MPKTLTPLPPKRLAIVNNAVYSHSLTFSPIFLLFFPLFFSSQCYQSVFQITRAEFCKGGVYPLTRHVQCFELYNLKQWTRMYFKKKLEVIYLNLKLTIPAQAFSSFFFFLLEY